MHLSHVGIYLTTLLTPTDASLAVRESLGICLNSLSIKAFSDGHPKASRGEGDIFGLQHSGTIPSLILTWLAWVLQTTALNSAWADLSQEEGNKIFLCNTSSLLHQHALQGVTARWICPAFPWKALPNTIPVWRWAEQWEKHHTACAFTSPGLQGQGLCLITLCPWRKEWVDLCERENRFMATGLAQGQPYAGHSTRLHFSKCCWSYMIMLQKGRSPWSGLSLCKGRVTWCQAELNCTCLHWRICSGFCFTFPRGLCPL